MKLTCLSVRQPFASAILTGQKVEEYRSYSISHRGLLAIHAGKSLAPAGFADYPNFRPDRVALGAVLGVVEVVGCSEITDINEGGDYVDAFAWLLKNPRWLRSPLPLKGRLGLFPVEIPDELLPALNLASQAH